MEYEIACSQIRDDIARTLFEIGPPSLGAASLAANATRDIADALHHAAGRPADTRWVEALDSLERFVEACRRSPRAMRSPSFASLRSFLEENVAA